MRSEETCTDVIIVGGGVVGNAAAYNLAKKGQKVLLLERNEIGDGGSSRNGGGVRQSAREPAEMPLAMYAVRNLWPSLSEELGVDTEYCQGGNIKLAKKEKHMKYYEGVVASNRAMGLSMEMLDGKQTHEICPIAAPDVIGSCYCPTDGHANPLTTTLGYYKRGRELGVRHITGEKVTSVETWRGRAVGVRTDKGSLYSAGKIILACGYEARELLTPLGIDIPIRNQYQCQRH
ncbi:MAG: FAD-binding oxidoreductase [Eubacterium sp.]|nr:FAD-binding oxidoreductase [Eubacterium sp.]